MVWIQSPSVLSLEADDFSHHILWACLTILNCWEHRVVHSFRPHNVAVILWNVLLLLPKLFISLWKSSQVSLKWSCLWVLIAQQPSISNSVFLQKDLLYEYLCMNRFFLPVGVLSGIHAQFESLLGRVPNGPLKCSINGRQLHQLHEGPSFHTTPKWLCSFSGTKASLTGMRGCLRGLLLCSSRTQMLSWTRDRDNDPRNGKVW